MGNKRPDLVDVHPDERRIRVSDITQRFGDPSHEFKTRFYQAVLDELFDGTWRVEAQEFHTVFRSREL
ncbi:MAG TPA: hypothetical protein VGJ87_09170 [Roseiflexaceae bacterium]